MIDDVATAKPAATSRLEATFARSAARTYLARLHEAGALRLRQPRIRRAEGCEGLILNTGGGVLGGDRLSVAFELEPSTDVTLTTVAAEKVYRAAHGPARIDTTLVLGPAARAAWIPQETILFDHARLDRTLAIDMAEDATLLAAEMLVFGRLAMGETAISATLRDSWRVRRGGRLVFADATRVAGDVGAVLDRPALGAGARAVALVLLVTPDVEARIEPLRERLGRHIGVTAGVSAFDGLLVARLLARSPELLRGAMVAALTLLRGTPPPRVWQ